jgi:spermidine synthase
MNIEVPSRENAHLPKERQIKLLHLLFFFSGFPALLYQIIWQRALFAIYGVNIQSVTIVVSAFMLGLGVGSLLGGIVSKNRRVSLLAAFGIAELGTAAFGIVSLNIFHYAAIYTAGAPPLKTGFLAFALLIVPTVLMGSTLPILVAYMVGISGNVGRSLASLYFVNTLGSAVACFLAAGITMRFLGESGTVDLAAAINFTIGITILAVHNRARRAGTSPVVDATRKVDNRESDRDEVGHYLPLPAAAIVSGLAGFIALGYEILWYRGIAYGLKDKAPVFAGLLGCYLLGIALGSFFVRGLCRRARESNSEKRLQIIAGLVIAANVLGFLVLPATAFLARIEMALGLPLLIGSAALMGATFPLISAAAVKPDYRVGRGVSLLYLSNIVGSTLGSFVVGYVLMNYWSTRGIAVFLALTGTLVGIGILLASAPLRRTLGASFALTVVITLAVCAGARPLFDGLYVKLEEKKKYVSGDEYKYLVETRTGILAVKMDDTMLGGGVYDGVFNTDLMNDRNLLFRPFSMSLWHPAPRTVLMVGLSTGSWAQIVANNPQVDHLTIVEINPGYLRLIPKYPMVASLLRNPKVSIVIDDGRRWLLRNRDASFDVVMMNTTYHWRAHATNLLSSDFLKLVRHHLNPGGVLFYNTTWSRDVQLTGVTVFPYGLLVGNCLVISDSPIVPDLDRWKRVISEYRIDDIPVLPLETPQGQQRFLQLASLLSNLEGAGEIRKRTAGARVITDNNMASEW